MKVLITTDSYLPRLGGQEIGAFRLAKYLVRKGHRIRIFTTEKQPFSGPEEGGLEVIRAPHVFDLRGRARLRRMLLPLVRDSDVVHARYSYRLAALAAPLARAAGRRFVVSLHGMGSVDNPHDSWLRRLRHRGYRRRSLRAADAVIATSRELARRAAGHALVSRIHVVPNGIDTDEFDAARPAPPALRERFRGRRVVLAIARLDPRKGMAYLIQAAPRVVAAVPDAHVVIGGWGVQEEFLRRLAADLGLADRVTFAGPLANRDVPGWLALAEAVVFPSSMESTSHACLEAMAMGRPVVASRIGGLVDLLADDRGILVDLFDGTESIFAPPPLLPEGPIGRLSKAITAILSDRERAARLAAAARIHALATYDWNVLADRVVAIYRGGPGADHRSEPAPHARSKATEGVGRP